MKKSFLSIYSLVFKRNSVSVAIAMCISRFTNRHLRNNLLKSTKVLSETNVATKNTYSFECVLTSQFLSFNSPTRFPEQVIRFAPKMIHTFHNPDSKSSQTRPTSVSCVDLIPQHVVALSRGFGSKRRIKVDHVWDDFGKFRRLFEIIEI